MPSISAVIITKNEAGNLPNCLKSLQPIADEILVIDAFSTDDTVAIAQHFGAKVIQQEWKGYAENKNLGNSLAKNDWLLSIDADEVLSDELVQTLQNWQPNKNEIYAINRLTNYCGKWIYHSGWHPDWKVRLFNRNTARWEGLFVHEQLRFPADYSMVSLTGLLYHYSYKSSEDHWQRINRYAELSAQKLLQQGKTAGFIKIWLSPIARFFRTFFLKKGFLDGWEGWIISWRNAVLVHRKYQLLKRFLGEQKHST